jgi:membrane fusion protein, multidrug efflux system
MSHLFALKLVKYRAISLFCCFILVNLFHSCDPAPKNSKATDAGGNILSYVEGIVVKPSVLEQKIMVSGTLIPFEETVLMPEVPGRVVSINLPEGQFVKKGTLLVKLFDGDLQANLMKSETQLQIEEETLSRQTELLKVNGISQTDYDQTRLQVSSIKDDIEVLKVQIGKTEIVAPFDGTIGLRNISVGAEVTPSTALATIRAENQLKLDFSVPGKYSSQVKPGDKVQFTIEGKDNNYDATVMATEEGIEADTRNLNVRAVVDNKSAGLIPGAFANVELSLGENPNALMVPTQAIIPEEREKKIILSVNGKATFLTVTTGVRKDSTIEVLDGIKPGDTVVTTGILLIRPGESLSFSKITK